MKGARSSCGSKAELGDGVFVGDEVGKRGHPRRRRTGGGAVRVEAVRGAIVEGGRGAANLGSDGCTGSAMYLWRGA